MAVKKPVIASEFLDTDGTLPRYHFLHIINHQERGGDFEVLTYLINMHAESYHFFLQFHPRLVPLVRTLGILVGGFDATKNSRLELLSATVGAETDLFLRQGPRTNAR